MLRRTKLALLAAALTPALAAAEVLDARIWGSGASLQPPTWIDARQILFLTAPGFKPNEDLRALAIWEVGGSAKIYRDAVNHYCYRDGTIVYKALDPADKAMLRGTWYAGPIGAERPVRKDAAGDVARLYDPINCRVGTSKEIADLARQTRRRTVPLLEKHGYLDVRPTSGPDAKENTPVQLVRANGGGAVPLPFGSREFSSTRAAYYDFAGSYLFSSVYFDAKRRESVTPWPSDAERPAWMVRPDGAVTKHTIPKGPWSGKDDPFPYLTKAGLVLVRHGGIFEKSDGLYLVNGSRPDHLLQGRVSPVGVSPDGCSIAFTHAPSLEADNADEKNRRTLKVMRLCKS